MLLSLTLPLVDDWLILVLEAVQEVLSITKEAIATLPWFRTEPTKLPFMFVLHDHHCGVPLATLLIKSDQRATILVHAENTFPLTLPVVTR